jgi:hypothetical protein
LLAVSGGSLYLIPVPGERIQFGERRGVIKRRQTPLEHFVERALSMSSVSRDRIGARVDELAREVREVMAPFAQEGMVVEVVESEALIARRAPPGDGKPDLGTG